VTHEDVTAFQGLEVDVEFEELGLDYMPKNGRYHVAFVADAHVRLKRAARRPQRWPH
jgi:hypothetical protein